jgi:uncharacterized membrane protein
MMSEHPLGPSALVQRQLIDAYLFDLDHALSGLDESERADVLVSVREHISDALSERPAPLSAADVEAVLNQLGPVERIASAANIHTAVPRAVGTGEDHSWSKGTAAVLVALSIVSLVILPMFFLALPLALGVTICAVIGVRANRGSASRVPYWIATALGSLTIFIGLIMTFGLVAATVSPPTVSPATTMSPVPTYVTPSSGATIG